MKRIFKVLEGGSGEEFFVFADKRPRIKNNPKMLGLCCRKFCREKEDVLEYIDDYFIDEVKPIKL